MIKKLLLGTAILGLSYQGTAQCVAGISSMGSVACYLQNYVLNASPGGVAYQWYNAGVMIPGANADTLQLNGMPPGTYQFSVAIDFGGCSDTSSPVSISIYTLSLTLNNNSPVCENSTLQLSVIGSGGTLPYTYNWVSTNNFQSVNSTVTIPNVNQSFNGQYYVTVMDANGCWRMDSTSVVINPSPSIIASYTNPSTLTSNDGSIVLSGLTNGNSYTVEYTKDGVPQLPFNQIASGGNLNIGNLGGGSYTDISASLNGCMSNLLGPLVLVPVTTASDSVWPGDVNYDLLADNNDALDLALAYGQTGTTRTGASNTWVAQYSADWGLMQVCNYDMKHADCNGDGIVDANDTTAISLNYGQVHLKGEHVPQAKSASAPDLYFDITGINLVAGTTVNIPIKLGTSAIPMNNIMGLAANVHVGGISLGNAPTINASTSWLGNSSDLLNYTHAVSSDQTDWTLARTDHNNASGDGTIAILSLEIPTGVQGQDITLYFDDVKMIDNNGTVITNYNVVDDTATVLNLSEASSILNYVKVVPNPSEDHAQIQVSLAEASVLNIAVTDITGRCVWSSKVKGEAGMQHIALPASEVAPGIYNVTVRDGKGVVHHLKWLKK